MHDITVLTLTGPPAAGKSTVVGMLQDIGIPCTDTGEAIRAEARSRHDDPDEDTVWQVAQDIRDEHGPAGPTVIMESWIADHCALQQDVICISSVREQAEVEWLRENVASVLTIRIDADQTEREYRYVEQKIDDEDDPVIDTERIQALRAELRDREDRESPYPDHDVMMWNDDAVDTRDVYERLQHIVDAIRSSH